MIDTHSHILPGVDDGSASLDDSLEMARAAYAGGIREIVCTPHLDDPDSPVLYRAGDSLVELRARLAEEDIGIALRLGFEVSANMAVFSEIEELASFAIEGGGSAVLVEVPHHGWPSRLEEAIFRMRTNGLTPVLAHPERNDHIQRDPDLLARCIGAGAVVQATAASLGPDFGKGTKRAFFRHLGLGQISLMGTDAHHHRRGSWTFTDTLSVVHKRLPAMDSALLVDGNPMRLLQGERLLPVERSADGASISWWRRRFLGVQS
ncbi:MAG TPA: CpsB/CapC family capsule biosynthesis tyrosine phosphatase [Thermoleophilia bacterium]